MLYICTKIRKLSLNNLKLKNAYAIHNVNYKEHKICKKNCSTYLFSAHCLLMLYICSEFHENIFVFYKRYRADTIFTRKYKRVHFVNNMAGAIILVLRRSAVNALYVTNFVKLP